MSSTEGKLPAFLIVGAAKAGTTTLHARLGSSGGIFFARPKEPAFFSNPEIQSRGLDWYRGLFSAAEATAVCGEASTTYSRGPYDTAPNTLDPWPRIAEVMPGVKVIYIVRHPLDRAYSHYRHWIRTRAFQGFERATELQPPILDCSRYRMQIERMLEWIPRSQLHLELFDDLADDMDGVVARVRRFIGLPVEECAASGTEIVRNAHSDELVVGGQLARVPGARWMLNILPRRSRRLAKNLLAGPLARRILSRHYSPPRLRADERASLSRQFAIDVAFVEEFMGRSLGHWRD